MALTVGTNTYVDEAAAAEYCELAGLDALANPETSLKRATLALDRLYGGRFIGVKASIAQALAWPRRPTASQVDASQDWYVVDSFGNYRDFNGIPVEVQQATVELAVLIEDGKDVYLQPEPRVVSESVELDVIKQSRTYLSGYMVTPLNKVNVILAPLLTRAGSIRLVR